MVKKEKVFSLWIVKVIPSNKANSADAKTARLISGDIFKVRI